MYLVIGKYKGTSEVLDESETKEFAQYLAKEYKIAFGSEWTITIKKSTNTKNN